MNQNRLTKFENSYFLLAFWKNRLKWIKTPSLHDSLNIYKIGQYNYLQEALLYMRLCELVDSWAGNWRAASSPAIISHRPHHPTIVQQSGYNPPSLDPPSWKLKGKRWLNHKLDLSVWQFFFISTHFLLQDGWSSVTLHPESIDFLLHLIV